MGSVRRYTRKRLQSFLVQDATSARTTVAAKRLPSALECAPSPADAKNHHKPLHPTEATRTGGSRLAGMPQDPPAGT